MNPVTPHARHSRPRNTGRRLSGLLPALIALVIFGCGKNNSTTASTTQPPRPSQHIVLHRTGGIAGVDDRLTIDDQGQTVLMRTKPPLQRSNQLPPGELDQLHQRLAAINFGSIATKPNPNAADVFVYTLDYQAHHIAFDDTNIAPQLRPVIDQLTAIIAQLAK